MAITCAVQDGPFIYLCNEKQQQVATMSAGSHPPTAGFKGYTSTAPQTGAVL